MIFKLFLIIFILVQCYIFAHIGIVDIRYVISKLDSDKKLEFTKIITMGVILGNMLLVIVICASIVIGG